MASKMVRNLLNSKWRGNNYERLTNNDDSKPQEKKKTEIVRSEKDQITIEEIFARFPDLSECIFIRLDDRSLASCREVNKTWKGFVDIQRIYWIRKILRYANLPQSKFHGEWKMILENTPIKFLKQFAAFVWIEPEIKSCPLYVAGALGDLELFNCIKEKTGLNENSKNNVGLTPFHVAAVNNRLSLCEAIIEKLQDKNPRCNLGGTPLHQAAFRGHLKICQLIMDKVDDKNPKSNSGYTPLHIAAAAGHLNICQLFHENIIGTGLQSSKALKKLDGMNSETNNGYTPPHMAARFGHVEVCKFFSLILEEKNPKNSMGVTSLHVAAEHGQLEVCKYLCSNLQEKNPKDDNGRTPLNNACSKEHWKVVHFLIVENNLH